MSVPNVRLNQLDNQIGVAQALGDVLAIVGPASTGTKNVPVLLASRKDLAATFGEGPMPELGHWLIETHQTGQIVFVRTDVTTVGGYGTIDVTGVTGTSVASNHTATEPYDDFDVVVTITLGGTVGTGPISYTYSLDGGKTTSVATSLGTLNHIDLPGNIRIDLAAGTLVTGDVIRVRTSAAKWNGAQLATALTALKVSSIRFDIVAILGPCTAADAATIETAAAAMEAADKERTFIYATRNPNVGETDSTYQASLTSAFATTVAKYSSICAGSARIQSPVSQRRYIRPAMWAIVGRVIDVDAGTDPAEVARGSLPTSVQILDDAGNPDLHDEYTMPGLDDQRFSALRTWGEDLRGVYINNCRVFSDSGSDFQFIQHRRVMNKACQIIRRKLRLISSGKVFVNKKTGFILEGEALRIENSVNRALKTGLLDSEFASNAAFVLSRTDNLLSTFKLTGAGRITPLGYVKFIQADVGYFNPVNNAKAV